MMQQTWGRHVTDKELYSDVSIPGVKTINVGYEKTGPSGNDTNTLGQALIFNSFQINDGKKCSLF